MFTKWKTRFLSQFQNENSFLKHFHVYKMKKHVFESFFMFAKWKSRFWSEFIFTKWKLRFWSVFHVYNIEKLVFEAIFMFTKWNNSFLKRFSWLWGIIFTEVLYSTLDFLSVWYHAVPYGTCTVQRSTSFRKFVQYSAIRYTNLWYYTCTTMWYNVHHPENLRNIVVT